MAKKKSPKALIEVMGGDTRKGDKRLGVPGWFGQAKPVAGEAPVPAAAAEPPAPAALAPSKPPRPVAAAERELAFSTAGGRLRICLSTIAALLILLGLIALMALAFALGRVSVRAARAGESGAPGKPEVASLKEAPPGVVPVPRGVRGPRRPAAAPAIGDDATRSKGYHYLVIQGGIDSRQEAEHVKRFLYDNGIDATIHRMGVRGKYMVKDLRGYKDPNSAKVREYVEKIIQPLGQEYMRAGGGKRNFGQRQDAPPWMVYER